MLNMVKFEAKGIRSDFNTFAARLDVWLLDSQPDWVKVGGEDFELACLAERFETGNWSIPLDEAEASHDHLVAQQKIDPYVV